MSDGLSSEELLPRIGDSVTRIHLSLSLLQVLISWSCMRCSFVFDDLYRWTQKFVHVGGLGRIFSILKELSQECRYRDKVVILRPRCFKHMPDTVQGRARRAGWHADQRISAGCAGRHEQPCRAYRGPHQPGYRGSALDSTGMSTVAVWCKSLT